MLAEEEVRLDLFERSHTSLEGGRGKGKSIMPPWERRGHHPALLPEGKKEIAGGEHGRISRRCKKRAGSPRKEPSFPKGGGGTRAKTMTEAIQAESG